MFSPFNEMSNDEMWDEIIANSEAGDFSKNAALIADYAQLNRTAELPLGPLGPEAAQQENRYAVMLLMEWTMLLNSIENKLAEGVEIPMLVRLYWGAIGKYFVENGRTNDVKGIIDFLKSDKVEKSHEMLSKIREALTKLPNTPEGMEKMHGFLSKFLPLPSPERLTKLVAERQRIPQRLTAPPTIPTPPTELKRANIQGLLGRIQGLADWYVNSSMPVKIGVAGLAAAWVLSDFIPSRRR
ncbi:MAG: hypothetical protein ACRYFX_14875 [Janthinobacterium lividum]